MKIGTLALQVIQGRAIGQSHLGTLRPSSFDRSLLYDYLCHLH